MQSSLLALPPAFTPCKKSWQSFPDLFYQTDYFFNYFWEKTHPFSGTSVAFLR
jgi:hypothetical protein